MQKNILQNFINQKITWEITTICDFRFSSNLYVYVFLADTNALASAFPKDSIFFFSKLDNFSSTFTNVWQQLS
jgi:hypothetical protein